MRPDVVRSAALALCLILAASNGYAEEQLPRVPTAPTATAIDPKTEHTPQRDTPKPCALTDLKAPLDALPRPLDDIGCPR